jgi:acyl dehydratase
LDDVVRRYADHSLNVVRNKDNVVLDNTKPEYPIHRFTTHRRTVTETDIVNFVNLAAMHEPYFIDMEFLKQHMSGAHQNRFMPGPMIASYAMGLVAPILTTVIRAVLDGHRVGTFAGMTGFEVQMKAGVFTGDTIQVELEAYIKSKSSRGYTAIDLRHITKNQHGTIVADLIEHVLFHPPQEGEASGK